MMTVQISERNGYALLKAAWTGNITETNPQAGHETAGADFLGQDRWSARQTMKAFPTELGQIEPHCFRPDDEVWR
jgi:hypothetical protein